MEEILHHFGCIKPRKHEVNYQSSGAGFQPSTVLPTLHLHFYHLYNPNIGPTNTTCLWGKSARNDGSTAVVARPYPDFVDQGEQGGHP